MEKYFKDIEQNLEDLEKETDIQASLHKYKECKNKITESQKLLDTSCFDINNIIFENETDNLCLNEKIKEIEHILKEIEEKDITFLDFIEKYKHGKKIINKVSIFLEKSKSEIKQLIKDNDNNFLEITYN